MNKKKKKNQQRQRQQQHDQGTTNFIRYFCEYLLLFLRTSFMLLLVLPKSNAFTVQGILEHRDKSRYEK